MKASIEKNVIHKKSAGLLLFRFVHNFPEVLLAHPGGPFWKNKDAGAWTIPKGEFTDAEVPLEAAKREFKEETGMDISGEFIELSPLKQKNGKIIYAWLIQKNIDAAKIKSNTFELEWPLKSGNKMHFPEIDKAEWFTINTAKEKIIPGQSGFIEQFENYLEQISYSDGPH